MSSRKIKKISYIRFALVIVLFLLYLFWEERLPTIPCESGRWTLFANQCDDELCPLIRSAIASAENSIFMSIYTLSDSKVIHALEKQAEKGVTIKAVVDPSSPSCRHPPAQIEHLSPAVNGLMHRKVLVIDEKEVVIGSANFTSDSLHCDDNLFVAFSSEEIAKTVLKMEEGHFLLLGQPVDFYPLPEAKEHALNHLLSLLEGAQHSLTLAMFTLTHPELIEEVIAAHKRGVKVEVACDRKQADGASKKGIERLVEEGVPVALHVGGHAFHHKFACIDKKTLAFGSVNWTRAGFSKNEEVLVIIDALKEEEIAKLTALWHAIRCTTKSIQPCLSSKKVSSASAKNPPNSILEIFPTTHSAFPNCSLESLAA